MKGGGRVQEGRAGVVDGPDFRCAILVGTLDDAEASHAPVGAFTKDRVHLRSGERAKRMAAARLRARVAVLTLKQDFWISGWC